MKFNRSVPVDTVLPHVTYPDVAEAIAWLGRTFGFEEQYRYGDPNAISGAQVYLGRAVIQLRRAREGWSSPRQLGFGTQSLTVFVDDVDRHFERARDEAATIVEGLQETLYGERQYGVDDFAGHHWLFSTHAHDVNPADWGAAVAENWNPDAGRTEPPAATTAPLPTPRLCYLQIPSIDPHQSAAFYEAVFRWNIRKRDSKEPSFDDPSSVSGAWVTGRPISREPGLLPYVWVDDIEALLNTVTANGGVVVEGSHPDHPGSSSHIATFRDPAGNLIGLYHEAG